MDYVYDVRELKSFLFGFPVFGEILHTCTTQKDADNYRKKYSKMGRNVRSFRRNNAESE